MKQTEYWTIKKTKNYYYQFFVKSQYLRCPSRHLWLKLKCCWGEQVDWSHLLYCCNRWMIFIQDWLSSIALITFLCYLFKYALAHTHTHLNNCTHRWTYLSTEKKTDWTQDTHSDKHTQTHTHLCALLFPSPAVLANDALVFFVSKCSAKRMTSKNGLSSSFFFFFFKHLISIARPGLARWLEIKVIFNSSSTFRKFHVFLKNKNINAHIAQLSCTLVCLKPTALFWDNIRGFKPEYRTFCIRQSQWVSVAVFPLFISTHLFSFFYCCIGFTSQQ